MQESTVTTENLTPRMLYVLVWLAVRAYVTQVTNDIEKQLSEVDTCMLACTLNLLYMTTSCTTVCIVYMQLYTA